MPKAIILTLTLLFCAVLFAQDLEQTDGAPNGRLWNSWPQPVKTFYLVGIRDGLVIADGMGKEWPTGFVIGDYLKELNKLYGEGENVKIPIWTAFRYVSLKLRGNLQKDKLESVLIQLRQVK